MPPSQRKNGLREAMPRIWSEPYSQGGIMGRAVYNLTQFRRDHLRLNNVGKLA
jgi:hypothetical protein